MSYYAIRFASAPDHIRIEKAEDPRTAHRRAFGPFTKMTRWEWKDLGTRVRVIQTDSKRIALLKDPKNWHKEGPATDSDSEEDEMPNENSNLRQIARTLISVQKELELQISATPSGERRNQLCDANIHIGAAISKIVDGR